MTEKQYRFKSLMSLLRSGAPGSLRAHLIRGSAGSFAIRVSAAVLGFVTSIILARTLGAEGFGTYAYIMALVTLLAIPTTLGLPNLMLRYVAAYQAEEKWGLMRGLLGRAGQMVILLSLVIAFVATIAGKLLVPDIDENSLWAFWLGMAVLPVMAIGMLRAAVLRGLHHVVRGQIPDNIVNPVVFLMLVTLAYYMLPAPDFNPAVVMGGRLVAGIAAFAVGSYFLWKHLPRDVKEAPPEYEVPKWIKSGIPLLMIGGIQVINHNADILMLGAMKGAYEAGVYRVVTRSAELIPFVQTALSSVISPTLSRLYTLKETAKLQRTLTLSARFVLLCAIPIAICMILFGSFLLRSIFGEEYGESHVALSILSSGMLANVAMGYVGALLVMTGYEKEAAKGGVVAAVLNIALNAVLIPPYGIEGAATATALSLIAWSMYMVWCARSKLGIDTTALGLRAKNIKNV